MEIRGNAGQFGQGKSNGCSGNREWKSLEGLGETGPGNSYQKSYPGTGLSFGLVPFHFVSISYQTARLYSPGLNSLHFTRISPPGETAPKKFSEIPGILVDIHTQNLV